MQKGDIILVDYTGRDTTTGTVFDTTVEADAKAAKVFDARITYKPVPISLGKHEMLAALEDEMEKMKVGETRKVVLAPKQAFGERSADRIRIASLKDFREHQLAPHPGMLVEVNGTQGRVQSVSSGRVRVDFNHPLAGKTLEYGITVRQKIDGLAAQTSAFFDKFFPFVAEKDKKVSERDGELSIELPQSAKEVRELELLKQVFEKVIIDQLQGVKKVSYSFSGENTTEKKTVTAAKAAPADTVPQTPKKAAAPPA
jgi:FKBP-type peptidyl-prolyl cis-trans isomerase 2